MKPIHSGRVIAGKYRLEACRARGGMGSVWSARHLVLDAPLALKFIEPQFAASPEARGRFEREAKTVALLQGIHVAQIHDYGVEDGIPYIVMELLRGEDLCARLLREKRLPLRTAVHIVHQVSKVLRQAHEVGIIHRDLKPGNIFLVADDEEEEIVKVLDFGVAKTTKVLGPHADPTKSGTLVGSPRYMSPEQARGIKELDHRSDLWSLGVIAFRMVTGELPFPGTEIGDVILKICTDPVPVPSWFVPGLSPEIDRFFARALERDPDKRFQSAREMARAFAEAAGLVTPSYPAAIDVLAERRGGPSSWSTPLSDSFQLPHPIQPALGPSLQSSPTTLDELIPPSMAAIERTLHSHFQEEEAPVSPQPCSPGALETLPIEPMAPHEMGVCLSNAPKPRLDRPRLLTASGLLTASVTGWALDTRLGWGVTGAAAASLLLGGFLLLFRPAPVAALPEDTKVAESGAGDTRTAGAPNVELEAPIVLPACGQAAAIGSSASPACVRASPPPMSTSEGAPTASAAPPRSVDAPAAARRSSSSRVPRRSFSQGLKNFFGL